MIVYIIKSSLCLALLWTFYKLFLEKEQMHYLKRFYLLFSLIFAYTIPLITISYETDVVANPQKLQPVVTSAMLADGVPIPEASVNYISILLWTVYGIGFLIFAIRFVLNMNNLIRKINKNEKLKEPSHINVLLGNSVVPHTFLRYIFVPKREFKQRAIPQEVLLHEKTHVRQKHTLDVLLIEVFQMVFWFNPMWFWIKKSIKLNHEFLADQTVLKRQFSLQKYINVLVDYPNSSNQTMLSSPINYSLTKKRIIMMSQQFSKTRAAVRLLLLLPVLLGCTLLFNNQIVAQQKNVQYTKTVEPTHPDKKIKIRVKNEQITVNGTATKLSDFASTIDEMTKQWKDNELTEFHFDVQLQNTNDDFLDQLNTAYRKTRLYKANSDGHDLVPPPPPLPPAPKMAKVPKEVKPLKAPKPPKVSKGERSNIPPLPPAPKVPPMPSFSHTDHVAIENEVALIREEAEMVRREAEIQHEHQATVAMHQVELAREQAEQARAIAMEAAHRAMEQSHEVREEAMRNAERARLKAEEHALIHEMKAREEARAAMRQAERAREKAMANAEKVRRHSEKARRQAIEEARKAHNEARKAAEEARKEARKAIEQARKEQRKARKEADKQNN